MESAQRPVDAEADTQIRRASVDERDVLFEIWLRSARATHSFVSATDIESFVPVVREYLASTGTELWLLQNTDGAVIGFMGMAGAQMESLFLALEFHRRGLVPVGMVEQIERLQTQLNALRIPQRNGLPQPEVRGPERRIALDHSAAALRSASCRTSERISVEPDNQSVKAPGDTRGSAI